MPSFKTSLNLKNGDWEVSLMTFLLGRPIFGCLVLVEGNETI